MCPARQAEDKWEFQVIALVFAALNYLMHVVVLLDLSMLGLF